MFLSFDNIIDLFFNALSNIMVCDRGMLKIEILKIEEDIDNIFYQHLWIKDNEYDGLSYHFNITLRKYENYYKIDSIYLIAYPNENIKITPYYYEGLTTLKNSLDNILMNSCFYCSEVKENEK